MKVLLLSQEWVWDEKEISGRLRKKRLKENFLAGEEGRKTEEAALSQKGTLRGLTP